MRTDGSRPTTSSREYSITRVNASFTHSILPSGEQIKTGLSVRAATSESLRASAWLSLSACSDSRRAVMSWTVPMIREGRPLGPIVTDFALMYTQRHSPVLALTRYSGSMKVAMPLSWDSTLRLYAGKSSVCMSDCQASRVAGIRLCS